MNTANAKQPVNILLVDDQPGKLLSYQTILAELGENLITATSGRDALEQLLKRDIAVVLVDVCMPEMDGFELSEMIRSHPRFEKTSIILISSLLTEDVSRLRGYVSGAVDYVSVPIVPEILRAKVSVFLELFRKTQALQYLNQELEKRVEERTAQLSRTAEQLSRAYEASHFLASIVQSSNDAIIGHGLDGRIRTWNAGAERLYQFTSDEVLGAKISLLTPQDRLDEETRILEKLISGDSVQHFETVRRRKDGTLVEVSLTISIIRDEGGQIVGASQAGRDITEQKRNAQLMLQTQKLESLGVLAGGIAHDFNNLLVGVLGNASLLLEILPDNSTCVELANGIVAAGENAAGLTRQMLAYAGRGQFVLKRLDFSGLVRETIPLIQAAVSRTVELKLDLEENLPEIEADPSQLQQVIMNLAINAAESIRAGTRGSVVVRTRREMIDHGPNEPASNQKPGVYVLLEIVDNGCGMDDETKARIFEPFFTTKFLGRGLGLAAVTGIVRGHSGSIEVFSVPGHGTTFRVLFPAAEGFAAVECPPNSNVVSLEEKGSVLIIDDEPTVRQLATRALEQVGFTPILAADGEAGIEIYRRNRDTIRCIVLDATMPGMSGEETLIQLKSISANTPVLLSSGFSRTELLARFEGLGIAGFLQKPYRTSELVQTISGMIRAASNSRSAVAAPTISEPRS